MYTITICRSMRFSNEMKAIAFILESKYGYKVLQFTYNEQNTEIPLEMQTTLKNAHLEKINISDDIYFADINH